jgi:hypothetical protein
MGMISQFWIRNSVCGWKTNNQNRSGILCKSEWEFNANKRVVFTDPGISLIHPANLLFQLVLRSSKKPENTLR